MIRCVHALRRMPGTTSGDFNAYWCTEHGPLIAFHQNRLGIARYVQTHRDPHAADAELQASSRRGGLEAPYDGVEEFWFPSEPALQAALSGEAGRRALREIADDESKFIEPSLSPLWFAHEYPQISTRAERIVARPKTGVRKVHFVLRALTHLTDADAQAYWHTMHGPLVRSHARARGVLCYQQVHRFETPLVDEWSALRRCAIPPYLGHAEAWFDALAAPQGAETVEAEAAAIGDERHFIDWPRSSLLFGKEFVFVDRDWI